MAPVTAQVTITFLGGAMAELLRKAERSGKPIL
ncbi:MAG: hypothetical protein RIS70_2852 [Planctomycetota bacterium]